MIIVCTLCHTPLEKCWDEDDYEYYEECKYHPSKYKCRACKVSDRIESDISIHRTIRRMRKSYEKNRRF